MKVYFAALYRAPERKGDQAVELCSHLKAGEFSILYRSTILGLMYTMCEEAARIAPVGELHVGEHQSYQVNALGPRQGIIPIMITEKNYPDGSAKVLLAKLVDNYLTEVIYARSIDLKTAKDVPFPKLPEYMKQFEDPHEADSLAKLKKELADTKVILHKTMDSMLERGTKLDELVAKSDRLSDQSKMFYTQAKKQNSCCVLM